MSLLLLDFLGVRASLGIFSGVKSSSSTNLFVLVLFLVDVLLLGVGVGVEDEELLLFFECFSGSAFEDFEGFSEGLAFEDVESSLNKIASLSASTSF